MKNLICLSLSMTFAFILIGCSSQAYQTPKNQGYNSYNNGYQNYNPYNYNYDYDYTKNEEKDTEDETDNTTYIPPYTYSFKIQGGEYEGCNSGSGVSISSYTTPSISTDSKLKVTVNAGSNFYRICNNSNNSYLVKYDCLQMTLTVGSHSETVTVSNTGSSSQIPFGSHSSACAGASKSKTVDFSDQAGSGPLKVTVSDVMYDNCTQEYGWSGISLGGCSLKLVYPTHLVGASLSIQTNKTK